MIIEHVNIIDEDQDLGEDIRELSEDELDEVSGGMGRGGRRRQGPLGNRARARARRQQRLNVTRNNNSNDGILGNEGDEGDEGNDGNEGDEGNEGNEF